MPKRKLSAEIDATNGESTLKTKRLQRGLNVQPKANDADGSKSRLVSTHEQEVRTANSLSQQIEKNESVSKYHAKNKITKRASKSKAVEAAESVSTPVVKVDANVEGGIVEKSDAGKTQSKRKRKTKEDKAVEAMPLAVRTLGHKLFIGAHVSSAGGQYIPM